MLCVEPLIAFIRESPLISAIKVRVTEHNLGLNADDNIIISKFPSTSISDLLEILKQFSQVSYYKFNHTISTIMPITNFLSA